MNADNHKNQSALDTLSEIRKALLVPTDNDPVAKLKQREAISATIGNLSNASEHVEQTVDADRAGFALLQQLRQRMAHQQRQGQQAPRRG